MNHRHRHNSNKVYLPSNARYNQYLLAEFKITDELLNQYNAGEQSSDDSKPYQHFYQTLSEQFFTECEQAAFENVHFIANDKLPRVRFSEEIRCWETEQQMLVFYNPAQHQSYKRHFNGSKRAKKVSLMFLATGEDIRLNAAAYHNKVSQMLAKFLTKLGLPLSAVRLRDHQHLTYNLFARQKGVEGTHSHTLRLIKNRYAASDVTVPENNDTMSYVVASLPITRKMLKMAEVDHSVNQPYAVLYNWLSDACMTAASLHNLKNGAFIADGSTPIIRNSGNTAEQQDGALIKLGYDPKTPKNAFICRFNEDKLADYVQIIFAATEKNIESKGYGKFMESVDKALRAMVKQLQLSPEHDEITVRFHQHLAYHVSEQ
jgi:hypothetical protein